MEEILASIRRIIADDQEVAQAPAAKSPPEVRSPPPAPPAAIEEEDVLELAEVAKPVKLANRPPAIEEEEAPEIAFRDIGEPVEPEPVALDEPAPPRVSEPAPMPAFPSREAKDDDLLSGAAHASVGNAFNMLAHTVLSSNARTLEDLVREMLRPMLKNWLDDNLPTIVERLVRAEIERVARGGR